MGTEFTITKQLPASPETIYNSWLSSEGHTAMTGGEAQASAEVGQSFTAWDGYISGTNVELVPHSRIVQNWRTTEFAEGDPDSVVEIDLRAVEDGCEFTLTHRNIPDGQPDYESGWQDHYIGPMEQHFK